MTHRNVQLSALSKLLTTLSEDNVSKLILPSSPIETISVSYVAREVQAHESPFVKLWIFFQFLTLSKLISSFSS